MNNREIAIKAAQILDDKKAVDVILIDIAEKSSFTDYLIVASGGSDRQVGALASEVNDQLSKEGIMARSVEGRSSSGWILLDYGDIIVNVFSAEQRSRYNIEKIWGDCTIIELDK